MFALELQRRSDAAGWNLISSAAHPGFARTNLFASGPGGLISLATDFAAPLFGHSAADGARPILFAATSPEAKPGAYYGPGGIGELRGAPAPALIMPQARNAAAAARLWEVSAKIRVRRSSNGRQMQLAKNVIDVELSTNNLEPMLRFWQQDAAVRFDHVLPVSKRRIAMAVPTKPGSEDSSIQTVLNAFDTLFNKRDYASAERFWSPHTSSTAHIFHPAATGSLAWSRPCPRRCVTRTALRRRLVTSSFCMNGSAVSASRRRGSSLISCAWRMECSWSTGMSSRTRSHESNRAAVFRCSAINSWLDH
jgi:hypothetical protein